MTKTATQKRQSRIHHRTALDKCPTPRKRPFPTRKAADKAMGKAWARPFRGGAKLPLSIYKCTCGQWHTSAKN